MLDFIINPISGGKNGKKMKKNVELIKARLEERKVEYRFHFTERKSHATELTKSLIESGSDNIIVVGGDGTLHEVINGFCNFDKVALGIIPCGTGNDFANALKIPEDAVKALDIVLDGTPKYTDFMQMPTVRGINIIGMGVDVDVLKYYNKLKKKSKFGYTKCLVKALLKFQYTDFDAITKDWNEHYRSFIACVANGYRYGGGIQICPPADATDKKLDFVAIKEMNKFKLILTFLKLKKGKIMSVKETVHKQVTEIKIDAPLPYTVNVDGELYDDIPFEVKIVSDTLRVYR